jgi:rubrerythrin
MTAREALASALKSEEKAHAFFVAALPHVQDPDVKSLFQELAEEEIDHQRMVKEQLDRQPEDPDLPADDFVDDPVAQ